MDKTEKSLLPITLKHMIKILITVSQRWLENVVSGDMI